jgi:hypothetical protein
MLKTFKSLTIILFLFWISFYTYTPDNNAEAQGINKGIKKMPVPQIPLGKKTLGSSKAAKHRDDMIKGKWNNPAMDALFNPIIEERFQELAFRNGNHQHLCRYRSADYGPNHPHGWDRAHPHYFELVSDGLCATQQQLYYCEVNLVDDRDISEDLVRGGNELGKCFCKFGSRYPQTGTFGDHSVYTNIVPSQYEGVCSAIREQ